MSDASEKTPGLFREQHRPAFHFTPREHWLNDPNGMVYYGGLYHLFYQHNPGGKLWGNMHWGHAVSWDLLHWEHRPVALHAEPEGLGYIFSGCAVVDWRNTSGLQRGKHPPLAALFTHHSRREVQAQSLAFSVDGGMNWRMHPGNPVIANPGLADFRDPKVLWDKARGRWLMALAAGDRVMFYRSRDLLAWERVGEFRDRAGTGDAERQELSSGGESGDGAAAGVWECPDLIPLRSAASERKWALLLSLNPGAPNGGSGTRYFIGDFDGECFRPEHDDARWLDYGPDNYASVSWFNMPEGDERCVIIGWMNNWDYANALPTDPWRGAMTIPRELSLIDTPAGRRLAAAPVRELESLRTGLLHGGNELRGKRIDLSGGRPLPPALEIELEVDWSNPPPADSSREWTLRFCNRAGEELLLAFHPRASRITASRAKASAGLTKESNFDRPIAAPVELNGGSSLGRAGHLGLRILKDASSLEVFQSDGRSLLSLNYFTAAPLDGLELAANAPITVSRLAIHRLNAA